MCVLWMRAGAAQAMRRTCPSDPGSQYLAVQPSALPGPSPQVPAVALGITGRPLSSWPWALWGFFSKCDPFFILLKVALFPGGFWAKPPRRGR